MNRIKYWVVNPKETTITISAEGLEKVRFPYDAILHEIVLPPDEVFDPPPPIRYGIEHKGWRVIQRELPDAGLNDLAYVDWRAIAQTLSQALTGVVEQEDLEDPAPGQAAREALDAFAIAEHEESLRTQGEPLPVDPRDVEDD